MKQLKFQLDGGSSCSSFNFPNIDYFCFKSLRGYYPLSSNHLYTGMSLYLILKSK